MTDHKDTAFEIVKPARVLREREGKIYETSTKPWIKLSTEFRTVLGELSGNQLKVFLSVALRVNKTNDFSPSIDLIATDTGLSRRTVIDAIKTLEGNEWLEVERKHRQINQYRIKAFVAQGEDDPKIWVQNLHSTEDAEDALGAEKRRESAPNTASLGAKTRRGFAPQEELTKERKKEEDDMSKKISNDQTPLAQAKASIRMEFTNGNMYAEPGEIYDQVFKPLQSAGVIREGPQTLFNFMHPDPNIFDDRTIAMLQQALTGVVEGEVGVNIFEADE